jgi:hypothetical protein
MTATLTRQSYGVAVAQGTFGGPQGVWLECTGCDESQKIVGAKTSISDANAAKIFRANGWTGRGNRMTHARCPACSGRLA